MEQRKRICETGKRWNAFILAMVLLVLSVSPLQVQAQTTVIKPVEAIDFSDFSNWRSGAYYYTNGQYQEDQYRICLNEYVTFQGDQYRAHITEVNFKLLVRELDQNKNFIRSCALANGQEYTPSNKAVYLGISLYKSDWETCMSYEAYRTKFSQGFVAELKPISTDNSESNSGTTGSADTSASEDTSSSSSAQVEYKNIENINLSDISNWRSGVYYYTNGQYQENQYRICLKNYVTFVNEEYEVSVSEKVYKILVRELDESKKFLRSVTLSDGQSYRPGSGAKYLAVILYKSDWETCMSFEAYQNMFASGFKVALNPVKEEEKEEESSEQENADSIQGDVPDTTKKPETALEALKLMLYTGDGSECDMSSYKVTYGQYYWTILPKLKEECYLEFRTGYNVYVTTKWKGIYLSTCKFENIDSDYAPRLKRTRASVDAFMKKVDSRMSDLEKVLLAHEYIVSNTNYSKTGNISYTAGGPLGDGSGVCQGYSEALSVLLHEMGIESDFVRSTSMNHGWTYVKLDGSWYHIDSTWDDTQKGSDAKYMHRFLIRNDEEFERIAASRPHSDWKCDNVSASSTSTKYTDWFVHGVAGEMYYYNGMWYYWDIKTNSVMRSNIQGTVKETVVDGSMSDKITLTGISDGVVNYSVGTQNFMKSL